MRRKIIKIDEARCNGCGACASACHEGAIAMVNGKAKLIRDDYCDGMGDCLPQCPVNAISFEVREAAAYDQAAVEENMRKKAAPSGGCPGSRMQSMHANAATQLCNWPVQLKLAPMAAPYFDGASLLVAADCTAYAYAAFHEEMMCGRVTLIGCPKLDSVDYSEKLAEIFRRNEIRDVRVVRMEVPCCGGLELAVKRALLACDKPIPCEVITLSIDGKLL